MTRLKILHTSAAHIGQINIAPVNWLLMACTIGLVMGPAGGRSPLTIAQNLNRNKILHTDIVLLHFRTENIPRVPNLKKIDDEKQSECG